MRTLLSLAFIAATAQAAPVPKTVELTDKHIVGDWEYEYGNWPNGKISFNANGDYWAFHEPDSDLFYSGKWKREGNAVTIEEWRTCLTTFSRSGPITYRFDFDKSRYPNLTGTSNGCVNVTIKNPRH